ncbi:unnamed protein product [Pleuronectes platessa]|uniref:Uncharacterized protein n=1 Tax=Pleuronectes platessa TaxID=8262 RepID=A0A9N7TJY1_PLEPL|nr:unnamed protein product [Pleuronectes platessa]
MVSILCSVVMETHGTLVDRFSETAPGERGQTLQYKLVVTRPISRDLFLRVPCAELLCLSKPLLARGSRGQFHTIFPQGSLRSPPKHPLLDHKLLSQSTLDRNPQ